MTMAVGPPRPPSITDGPYCSTPGILEAIPLDIARHPLRHKPLVIGTYSLGYPLQIAHGVRSDRAKLMRALRCRMCAVVSGWVGVVLIGRAGLTLGWLEGQPSRVGDR